VIDNTNNTSTRSGVRAPGGFYGWWILAISISIFAVSFVGQTQGFSVLLVPLRASLSIDPQSLALSFLIGGLLGAAILPFIGRLMDDRGVKPILMWSTVIYIVSLIALALIPVQAATLGALLMLRLVCSTVLWLGASVLVSLWFRRRRGFALGLLVGLGASILTVLAYGLSILIDARAVSVSLLVFAALLLVAVIPLVRWGIVDRPSLLGQHPDGQESWPEAVESMDGQSVEDTNVRGVTAAVAYRTPLAWIITLAGSFQAFVVTGYLFNEAVIFMQQGATGTMRRAV
jgi:MFS family permease